jgi:mannose-6-phosphate isomerase-like protein (cupin superfamily)
MAWTIIRPDRLTDDPGTGHVGIDSDPLRGRSRATTSPPRSTLSSRTSALCGGLCQQRGRRGPRRARTLLGGLELLGSNALAPAALPTGDPHSNGAAFFGSDAIRAKFATGGLLLDAGDYKLDAGRRSAPGEVEYHAHTVDVMHIVEGNATVVTGGEIVGARTVGNGEVRAESVNGGHAHDLSPGDVVAVPAGVPHQFTQVSAPFLYFVVKVEA